MNRRKFLGTTAGIAIAAGLNSPGFAQSEDFPTAVLGRTGKSVSRLGVGCGFFYHKRVLLDGNCGCDRDRHRAGGELY